MSISQQKKKKNVMMGVLLLVLVIALVAILANNDDFNKISGGSTPTPAPKKPSTDENAATILSDDVWKALLLYGEPIVLKNLEPGRNNPFLPF